MIGWNLSDTSDWAKAKLQGIAMSLGISCTGARSIRAYGLSTCWKQRSLLEAGTLRGGGAGTYWTINVDVMLKLFANESIAKLSVSL